MAINITHTVVNYTIITYGYFNIRSSDKDQSTQHEMGIPIIYKFLQKYNGWLQKKRY